MSTATKYIIYLSFIGILTVGGIYYFRAQKRKRGIIVEQTEGSTELSPSEPTENVNPAGAKATTQHFSAGEFACNDENNTPVPDEYMGNLQLLMNNLEVLRSALNSPITIDSGYRTPEHNATVGGKPDSMHLVAKASDIKSNGYTPAQIKSTIEQLISSGSMMQGGIGLYPTFVHYDVRGFNARW